MKKILLVLLLVFVLGGCNLDASINGVNNNQQNIDNSGTDLNKMVQFIRNVYTSFLNQEVLHNDNRKDMPKTGFIAYKEEQNDTSNQCSEIEH